MKDLQAFLSGRNLISLQILFLIAMATSACSQQDNGTTIDSMETRIAEMQGTVEVLKTRDTAEASGSQSDPQSVTPTPAKRSGRVSLVPVAIQTSEPTAGWINYAVMLALVNDSARTITFAFDPSVTIETQEGYRYEGEIRYSYLSTIPIPPGFRARGWCNNFHNPAGPRLPTTLGFSTAATAHPLRATTKHMGVIDLGHTTPLQFPTERASQEFADPGSNLQLKNKGTLTFGDVGIGVSRDTPGAMGFGYLSVLIETRFRNSDPGYQTDIKGKCYLFDGEGWVYDAFLAYKPGSGTVGGFMAGPGQESRGQIVIPLQEGAGGFSDLDYPPKLENAKLYCSIEGTEVILNLPTLP